MLGEAFEVCFEKDVLDEVQSGITEYGLLLRNCPLRSMYDVLLQRRRDTGG